MPREVAQSLGILRIYTLSVKSLILLSVSLCVCDLKWRCKEVIFLCKQWMSKYIFCYLQKEQDIVVI